MRNSRQENLCEHSLETAYIAHALGVINNKIFGGDVNCEHLAVLGMYHDITEIITGDMPTPVKYYSTNIRSVYKDVEENAMNSLLNGLPEEFRSSYDKLMIETGENSIEWKFIKAADKISAYLKCMDEKSTGNHDFDDALESTLKAIKLLDMKEADYFMENFVPPYLNTLDENIRNNR